VCWHGYLSGARCRLAWPSWCHCHSLSLASVKSRLVLPFWYRPTRVVPDKGPLNTCVCLHCLLITVLLVTFVTFSVVYLLVKPVVCWLRPFVSPDALKLLFEYENSRTYSNKSVYLDIATCELPNICLLKCSTRFMDPCLKPMTRNRQKSVDIVSCRRSVMCHWKSGQYFVLRLLSIACHSL